MKQIGESNEAAGEAEILSVHSSESGEAKSMTSTNSDTQNTMHTIQKGDRVIPQGKARWIRKGSQPLPRHLIPKGLSEAEEIVLGAIDGALFHDLTSVSRVIEVSADGQRAKVMSANGRKSVFPIEDLSKLEPEQCR